MGVEAVAIVLSLVGALGSAGGTLAAAIRSRQAARAQHDGAKAQARAMSITGVTVSDGAVTQNVDLRNKSPEEQARVLQELVDRSTPET
jgi:hypothetical protein